MYKTILVSHTFPKLPTLHPICQNSNPSQTYAKPITKTNQNLNLGDGGREVSESLPAKLKYGDFGG